MIEDLPFEPCPFLNDPHQQTIMGSFLHFLSNPRSEKLFVRLPDGDQLSLEVTTPPQWTPKDLTVLLVHGVCGSHMSPYLIRLVNLLTPLNIRSVRFNMRGCGSGKGLAKHMYHAGRSEDLLAAIQALQKEEVIPLLLIGFSLGGNVALKLAGELGSLAHKFLKGVIGVNPPLDLQSSMVLIGRPQNSLYEDYFMTLLREDVHYRHQKFKDLPKVSLPKKLKFYEFDQIYTAPFYGFLNARDYYEKCSSAPLIPDIKIPCKILLSRDDPIIAHATLDHVKLPSHISIFKTNQGGHMGYLGNPSSKEGFYWLDNLLVRWIQEFDQKKLSR